MHHVVLGELGIQEDVRMYGQLPYYDDDFHRFDISNEMDLSAISKRPTARPIILFFMDNA